MFGRYLKDIKMVNKGSPPIKLHGAWGIFFTLFIFLFIVSGCLTIPIKKVDPISIELFPAYEMADGSSVSPQSVAETIPDVDILAIDNNIKRLIDEKITGTGDPERRLVKLTELLAKVVKYDTISDLYGVKTAQQTFDTGTGNCLSFSNLFVAASRYAGLSSRFSEVPTLPSWSRDGEVLFFTKHIGATVDIRYVYSQVIQLRMVDDKEKLITVEDSVRYFFSPSELTPYNYRVSAYYNETISDSRAFAQYYNNIGSKYLAEGNPKEAYSYFIKAIKVDPSLSYAWSNLGVVYKRNNQLEAAEAAYLQGLSVTRGTRDTSLLSIINNLAHLYDAKGDMANAAFYKEQVASFRSKNPYYQYAAGKSAYQDAFYEKSVGYFREAIRLKKDEHLFHYGLALAYLKTGEMKKAEASMNKAIHYAMGIDKKSFYEKALASLKNSGTF
jgi:Flp pilus assembly protein TadD